MVKLTVLYGHPDDPDAFEEYYAKIPTCRWSIKCPTFRGTRRPARSWMLRPCSPTSDCGVPIVD
jgi:hypothetical protein